MPLVNDKVSSFRVAELAQPLFERLEERWWNWSRSEHADAQGLHELRNQQHGNDDLTDAHTPVRELKLPVQCLSLGE